MQRLKSFIGLTVLGGLTVILPVTVLAVLVSWLFYVITDLIAPLSALLSTHFRIPVLLADWLVLLMIVAAFFCIGLLVKTGVGRWLHHWMDVGLAKFAPGYRTIRDIVVQFVGGNEENSLLKGQVALVKLYGNINDIQVTGIVTAKYDGGFTVFVPTAPMPTSGMTYHVPQELVTLLPEVGVEQALRTVIACGAGSQALLHMQQQLSSSADSLSSTDSFPPQD